MDRRRAGTGSETVMPYVVAMRVGRILAQFNEAPGLTAGKILETESQPLDSRKEELERARAELEPGSLESLMAEQLRPMRALVLPWEESTAFELMSSNHQAEFGDRRLCLGIVGKRVFNEDVSIHLEMQP